jgi:hypothetical protein
VSVVAGLFARTLLARIRDSVEALFGRSKAAAGAAQRGGSGVLPASDAAGAPATERPAALPAASAVPADAANSSTINQGGS